MAMSAAHAVDDQMFGRLAKLRTMAEGDQDAVGSRTLRREFAVAIACLEDARAAHPLDADGWCVSCTVPPGAAELSTIYGCHTRVVLARHLLGLYTRPLLPRLDVRESGPQA